MIGQEGRYAAMPSNRSIPLIQDFGTISRFQLMQKVDGLDPRYTTCFAESFRQRQFWGPRLHVPKSTVSNWVAVH